MTIAKIISGARNFYKANIFVKSSTKTQKLLEKEKKQFKGLQVKGKKILVIGMG